MDFHEVLDIEAEYEVRMKEKAERERQKTNQRR